MFKTIVLLLILASPIWIGGSILSNVQAQTPTALENSPIVAWYGNDNFNFKAKEDILKVTMDKNPYEAFTLQLADLDLDFQDELLVSVKIQTPEQINVRMDLHNGTYSTGNDIDMVQTIIGSQKFAEITYDFSSVIDKMQGNEIPFILMYVNPGDKYRGNVSLKDLRIHTGDEDVAVDIEDVLEGEQITSGLSVFPNPASSFTNIDLPLGHSFDELVLQDIAGKTIIRQDIPKDVNSMQLKNLGRVEKGLYLLSVYGETEVLSTKISIY